MRLSIRVEIAGKTLKCFSFHYTYIVYLKGCIIIFIFGKKILINSNYVRLCFPSMVEPVMYVFQTNQD